ncbi:MAG: pyrroline-5-carboxylate reductase [Steroidobacteraceae bacterium]
MQKRIAFIGGGNMATSMISGLIARGTAAAAVAVADPLTAQRERLEQRFGVRTSPGGAEAAAGADIVVLAVKPQQMAEAARSLAPGLAPHRPLVVSIAAGIRLSDLSRWLGPGVPLVRAMPNLPALIEAGVSALYAAANVAPDARGDAEAILAACGRTVWVQTEQQLDAVTAVSGSGPAYFFLLIEALQGAGVALGLDPATARTLAVETAQGAGRMAAGSDLEPAQLREQVTSRGGTTAAALQVLEAAGLRGIFAQAVAAAARRSAELEDQYGTD